MPTRSTPRLAWAALALLTIFAFATRWVGLGALLPCAREADTVLVHVAAAYDRPEGAPLSDAAYPSTSYPFLFSGILIATPGSNYPTAADVEAPREAHLAAAAEPYVRARRLIALLSLLAVPATFLLARRWLEPSWSLVAAAFVVTSDLALGMSQQARPHAGLLGTNTVALVAALMLVSRASIGAYVAAGTASALALASLHSGLFVLPSLALAHLLGWRRDRQRARWGRFALALGICALAFVAAYPFLVFGDPLQREDATTLNMGQHAIRWETWNGRGFAAMWPGAFARDPIVVVAASVGLAALVVGVVVEFLRARRATNDRAHVAQSDTRAAEACVVGAHALVLIVLFGLQEQFYTRFLLPLLPAASVLAAYGLRAVTGGVAERAGLARVPWMRRTLATLVVGAILFAPTRRVLDTVIVRTRPDTLTLAARWVEAHVPPDAGPIGLDFSLDVPLWQSRAGLEERIRWSLRPWQRYQVENPALDAAGPRYDVRQLFDMGMMRERRIRAEAVADRIAALGIEYALVTVPQPHLADRDQTRAGVRRVAGEPLVTFRPDRVESRSGAVVQAAQGAASVGAGAAADAAAEDEDARSTVRERLGPVVEIYRIPR